jgi:tripeptide aminopeptidase
MNEQRLLETFFELVRIDSESKHEKQVAHYCKAALEGAGCSVTIDDSAPHTGSDTGNLIAELKGDLPGKLYFSAHIDTVTPGRGIEPSVDEDGIIRPKGATILGGDDKAGVAAILELIKTLAEEKKPHPTIGVLFTTCEELNLLGALALDSVDFNGEPCFVLDANGAPGKVIIAAPYHTQFTASFFGRAAHAGVEPQKGVSAIEMAARAISAMKLGRLSERSTANVGTIHGGNADNIVPDSCSLTGEFRAFSQAELDEVQAQLQQAIDSAVINTEGSVEVEWHPQFPGYEIAKDDPVVQTVLAVAQKLKLDATTEYSGGCSDANIFAHRGSHAIVLGTGMTNVHSLDEQLSVRDLTDLARLCIEIAYTLSAITVVYLCHSEEGV